LLFTLIEYLEDNFNQTRSKPFILIKGFLLIPITSGITIISFGYVLFLSSIRDILKKKRQTHLNLVEWFFGILLILYMFVYSSVFVLIGASLISMPFYFCYLLVRQIAF